MANTYQSSHTGAIIDSVIDYHKVRNFTITLSTTWTGDEAPYTQSVSTTYASADKSVVVGLDLSSVAYADKDEYEAEYSKLYRVQTLNGTLKFYANEPTEKTLTLTVIR